jgi:bifunctional non-homologous end joining protein LigD
MSLKSQRSFVVQKHKADKTGEHYDFRLEMPTKKGVKLVSWAIRKGPSLNPNIRRLAMATSDHDMQYGTFEGIIEKGQYGAGKTIVWDSGTYKLIKPDVKTKEGIIKAKVFEFELEGKKLKGVFVMIKTKQGWILKKKNDAYADSNVDITKDAPRSIISGKKIDDVTPKDGYIPVVMSGQGIE